MDADTASVDLVDASGARAWGRRPGRATQASTRRPTFVGGQRGGSPIEERPRAGDLLGSLLIDTLQNATQVRTAPVASGRGGRDRRRRGKLQRPDPLEWRRCASAKAAAEVDARAGRQVQGTGGDGELVAVGSIGHAGDGPGISTRTSRPSPQEEIAEALAYLCLDAAAQMNGQRLTPRGAA